MKTLKLKPEAKVTDYSPTEHLTDIDFIERALDECVEKGDTQAFLEILAAHLAARLHKALDEKAE